MKKAIYFLMLGLFPCTISYGQDCEKLLKDGLYEHFKMTNTGSFDSDFKSYLTSSSFASDLKNRKWGAGITVPIKGVPFTLSANADNTEISTFQQNVSQDVSFSVKQEYYSTTFHEIPNTQLAQIYSDCLPQFGIRVSGTSSGTGSDATFLIKYLPQNLKDPQPKVTFFNISGANTISNGLTLGQDLGTQTIVTCKRDPKKDLILVLQTDRGAATSRIDAEEIESSIESPIGTIVCSLLDFDNFSFSTSNNAQSPDGKWNSKFSKWAPADGRLVTGSRYSKVTLKNNLPDLRGVFIRGVNVFDPVAELNPASSITPVSDAQKNSDVKKAGEFQSDAIQDHKHHFNFEKHANTASTFDSHVGTGQNAVKGSDFQFDTQGILQGANVANETRPKNVSVFYYIRIN